MACDESSDFSFFKIGNWFAKFFWPFGLVCTGYHCFSIYKIISWSNKQSSLQKLSLLNTVVYVCFWMQDIVWTQIYLIKNKTEKKSTVFTAWNVRRQKAYFWVRSIFNCILLMSHDKNVLVFRATATIFYVLVTSARHTDRSFYNMKSTVSILHYFSSPRGIHLHFPCLVIQFIGQEGACQKKKRKLNA